MGSEMCIRDRNYVIKKCVLFFFAAGFYNTVRGTNNIPQIKKTEVTIMALSNLFGWAQKNGEAAASACGSACGAGDKPEEKPAACGSACGAGDK